MFTLQCPFYHIVTNFSIGSFFGVQVISNKGIGPYAIETDQKNLKIGDIVQLGRNEREFYHTPVVTGIEENTIFVCAHSYDAYMRSLSTYTYEAIRFLHIQGVRKA